MHVKVIHYGILTFLVATLMLPVATALAATPTIYANGVLAYTNAQRYRHGDELLESNVLLSEVARRKMQDLFTQQYFAHEAPNGDTVSDVAKDVGYTYIAVGENLALGDFVNNKAVVEAWMESEGHRENILSETFSEIGIAAGRSTYEGRNTWIVVQAFGLPRSSCPEIDESTRRKITSMDQTLALLQTIADIREKLMNEKGISRSTYNERVHSYNLVARLYNEEAERYRMLVAEFNDGVETYNGCVTEKVVSG